MQTSVMYCRSTKGFIGGVAASDFVFTVPQNLKHPLTGVDNSVRRSDNILKLRTKLARGVKHGFYEKVGGRYLRDGDPSEWDRVLPVMGVEL